MNFLNIGRNLLSVDCCLYENKHYVPKPVHHIVDFVCWFVLLC